MRLLPPNEETGWTPYGWLVYFLPFVAAPFLMEMEPAHQVVSLVAAALFLVLYFRGHWARPGELAVIIAVMTGLGAATVLINPGAVAIFIFAAAFGGKLGTTSRGIIAVALVVAAVALEAVLVGLRIWVWGPAIVFSLLIGGVNIHYGARSRMAARMRMADDQIEHLAKLAERERIGRDLHDLLGHTLSLIVLKSELARKVASTDPVRAAAEIAQVEQIARDALAEVRTAVTGYRSDGLAGEIRRASAVLRDAGLEVTEAVDPVRIPPAVESVLALVVREATTNILRHAGASRAAISLAGDDSSLRLRVADNGRGGVEEQGSGLSGMAERAIAVGGRLEIESAEGTVLMLTVPRTSEGGR